MDAVRSPHRQRSNSRPRAPWVDKQPPSPPPVARTVHSGEHVVHCAPTMASTGRVSGLLLPLFSLRSKTDFGIGDFGGLDGLFHWMEAARQRLLMLLPL